MRLQHPLNRLRYDRQPDGTVLVADDRGGSGIFDRHGNWISGNRRSADPMMCMFVADGYVPVWLRDQPTQSQDEQS